MIDLRFHHGSEKNRLGYYTVGAYHTYSKIDAIEVGQALGRHPVWHFNDAIFDTQDWTVEPKESLWELYTRRAWQLREKYDYLVLLYSGGADSHNILNAFVRNNIPIDEIMQFTNLELSGDKDNFWNAEIFRVAAPVTAAVIEQYRIKTRHRLLDLSSDLVNTKKIWPDLSYWIYGRNRNFSINSRVFTSIRQNDRDYQELMHRGKKLGFIWGYDKTPMVNLVSPTNLGRCYYAVMIPDTIDGSFNVLDQIGNNTWIHDEPFYWSESCPEILIKQGHTVKKFMAQAPENHPWFQKKASKFVFRVEQGKRMYLSTDGFNQLVYPYWDASTFSVGKPSSQIIGERDRWMLRHDSELRTTMFRSLREIHMRSHGWWADWRSGVKCLYSPAYSLGSVPWDTYAITWDNQLIPHADIRPRLQVDLLSK